MTSAATPAPSSVTSIGSATPGNSRKAFDKLFAEKQSRVDAPDLKANEFVVLKDQEDPSHSALARYRGDIGALVPVRSRRAPVFGIIPRNLQQTMAMDLLL